MEKIKLDCAVLCEGKYDKIKLSSLIDAPIFTTDGFSIFNNAEKRALIKKVCETRGLVIITDSDRAGGFIRSKLRGMLPKDRVKNVYIPQISGKEKRKTKASKDGFLGVEGVSVDILREIFEKYGVAEGFDAPKKCATISKAKLYELGLSGGVNSALKRDLVLTKLDLPKGLSAAAFCAALEILGVSYEDLSALCVEE